MQRGRQKFPSSTARLKKRITDAAVAFNLLQMFLFQEMMASVILAGLIYFICEVYLDDVIIFADNTNDFIDRLGKLFTRFRLKNICLKASKCEFGLSKIEYVGRTISKEGVSMSTKKINSVLDFPKPMVNTQ